MLASRTLPPIASLASPRPDHHPPPLAANQSVVSFTYVPRQYTKTKMRTASGSLVEETQLSPRLRKSTRVNDFRASGAPSPVDRIKNEGPTSAPLSPRSSRKRAAPLATGLNGVDFEDADSPVDSRHPYSATGDIPGQMCMCLPEPKIPRPRNAFILYRQHHQTAVAARNPGLANPEISKIIGEQWNAEPHDQKLKWQHLAQEEKAKHQEQYPDYRYQPRRGNKPGSSPNNSSGDHSPVDKYCCSKCGGRSIRTPTSPLPSGRPILPSPAQSEVFSPTSRYLPPMSNLSLDSPGLRRRGPGPSNLSSIQVSTPMTPDVGNPHSPGTPDSKRRRYNYATNAGNARRSDSVYYAQGRRDSLLPMNAVRPSPPNTAMLTPPPPSARNMRRGSLDLSVHVPDSHDQSRSVEAMIMSVPYLLKVKVLGRITPPLKDPGPTSPAIQVRGAIISVEGDDFGAVEELTQWLKNDLESAQSREYCPRIATPPRVPQQDAKNVTFEDYLDLIKDWHGKSREMIRYITTQPEAADSDSGKDDKSDKGSDTKNPDVKKKPVVILPTYQLHAANMYTSRIPMQDAYSPTDHWQWMATLWRGTVGPDLTIFIDTPDSREGQKSGKLVELNEEIRCLTVRKDKGANFDAASLRRVAFEVGEWIRDISNKAR
ncbi:hypothetical protein M011DRAFT_323837 [Sporormia fimetaria CBS 119925]|uniref:HMG box domain-containing protein n=1 Tax=Sporormia fimetaria CBS 119925 TaxID=1340428 RepID=A0A6A6VIL5_9PLEO|nr:hypothetical protein M011DRAFT_323837 [Sporormia fimetaria CBS 119925]